MPLTVCFAWCVHHAVPAYSWLDSSIPPSFPLLCNEAGNYAVFVQYVLCAMYVQITKCMCTKKKVYFWVMHGIFRSKTDDIQFCVHVWKCM
jgi:hypothetical protein